MKHVVLALTENGNLFLHFERIILCTSPTENFIEIIIALPDKADVSVRPHVQPASDNVPQS